MVLIHPGSPLVGQSLRSAAFRTRYQLQVLGLHRRREPVDGFEDLKLEAGDSLFLAGPWSRIKHLQTPRHDFVVLEVPAEQAEVVLAYGRMPVGLAILVGMVLLTLVEVVPLVVAVLIAPIAIYAAEALNVFPYPFALAVVIAASAAFSTQVSTPVLTLVVERGRYGRMDFVKIGVPLLLTYLATALVAPLPFPFAG